MNLSPNQLIMFNRPTSYKNLPQPIVEKILENCDLKYDPYEGSWDEVRAQVLNGTESPENQKRIQRYYESLDTQEIIDIGGRCIESLETQLRELRKFDAGGCSVY